MTITTLATQQQKGEEREIIVPMNLGFTVLTPRSAFYPIFALYYSVDKDVDETANYRTEIEQGEGN